eukprot:SAG31_NODE_1964_length_6799_cov_2.549552_7_plen_69_part_00
MKKTMLSIDFGLISPLLEMAKSFGNAFGSDNRSDNDVAECLGSQETAALSFADIASSASRRPEFMCVD